MPHTNPVHTRILLTFAITLYEMLHLTWEYMHDGIARHHLLQRADLPAISNWWGLILLPALGWFLIGRMQLRAATQPHTLLANPIALRFLAAFLYGAGLATAFAFGYQHITSTMFFGMLALGVAFPIFRAEYILGFVLGMTLIFGAVLPTIIACILALLSLALHPLAKMIVKAIWKS